MTKTGHRQCLLPSGWNSPPIYLAKEPSAPREQQRWMRKRVGLQRMQISRSYLIRVLQTARGCQFVGRSREREGGKWRKTKSCQWRKGEALYAPRRSSNESKLIKPVSNDFGSIVSQWSLSYNFDPNLELCEKAPYTGHPEKVCISC